MKTWDNFLEALNYQGAGAVELDAWFAPPGGSQLNEFLVTAEVYTDSPNGRYKRAVQDSGTTEEISPSRDNFSPGVIVSAAARTNIGCFNNNSSAQTIIAEVKDTRGALIETLSLTLGPNSWGQTAVTQPVNTGYIKWRPQVGCPCWAVVVDNQSNDGSYIPGRKYIP